VVFKKSCAEFIRRWCISTAGETPHTTVGTVKLDFSVEFWPTY